MGADTIPPGSRTRQPEKTKVANGNGNIQLPTWVGALLAALIAAGIVASVNTANQVGRMDESVRLLRQEVRREFDQDQRELDALESRLNSHLIQDVRQGGSSSNGG